MAPSLTLNGKRRSELWPPIRRSHGPGYLLGSPDRVHRGPLAAPAAQSQAIAARRPNVVILLADDLGFSDIGCSGGEIATPNLDKLAAGGLRFTSFYNTSRCWPSRAALLSGYYPQHVNRDPPGQRPAWAALLPDLLKPAGYRSYHSGKWHVDGPVLAGGFDRSYHVEDPNHNFSPTDHREDDHQLPRPTPAEGYYTTHNIALRAVDWLAEHESKHRADPFFLYVAFLSPHFPLQAPPEDIARYRDRYKGGWDVIRRQRWERQSRLGIYQGELSPRDPKTTANGNPSEEVLRRKIGPGEVARAVAWDGLTLEQKEFQAGKMAIHAAMVDRIDQEVGRILAKFEETGHLDDTLILFASDNGASPEQLIRGDGHDMSAPAGSAKTFLGLGPGWSTASNTPFRLHKSWVHEGGISTPLIVHWPSGISARGETRHAPSHLVDVVPTLLQLAGVSSPPSHGGEPRPPLAGRSLVPAFATDAPIDRDFLFFKHVGNRAIRVGDWKLVAVKDGPWELYDLARDRVESHDLAAGRPDKVRELSAIWERQDEEFRRQGATGKPLPMP